MVKPCKPQGNHLVVTMPIRITADVQVRGNTTLLERIIVANEKEQLS